MEITQELVKDHFNYDPESGIFTWVKPTTNSVIAGDICNNRHCEGYFRVGFLGKSYLIHRLAWLYVYGVFPVNHIDHINHDRTDNRIVNLRDVTRVQNQRNQSKNSRNTSGISGVTWNKGAWMAQGFKDKKPVYLGRYKNFFDACCARKSFMNRENYGY